MDTNIYWTLRGNYEEKKQKLGKWPRDHIEAIILDVTYNNFIRDCCDNNLLALEFGVETPIPIIGSHWRHIEFSCIGKIPIGKSPRMVGFMVKNKWDYPQRYLSINESQNVIDLLDEAIQHNQGENFKEVVTTLWRLRDYMQTLSFQRVVQDSYGEGNFTREEAKKAIQTVRGPDFSHLVDFERINGDTIASCFKTQDDESVLVRQPFRWLRDGKVVSNAYESYDLECLCNERGWEIVHRYGNSLAIVRTK
jgi:hypothetical protein